MKKCVIEINFCNSRCPYFYHEFDDKDAAYCSKISRKLTKEEDMFEDADCWMDHSRRNIPIWCPLEDA